MNPPYNPYMRPLQQPLFDTEIMPSNSDSKICEFFNTPIGGKFCFADAAKTKCDTNLAYSSSLEDFEEHSILGFNVIIDPASPQADRDAIMSNGALFEFFFSGHKPYLSVPLANLCARRNEDKSIALFAAERELNQTIKELGGAQDAAVDNEIQGQLKKWRREKDELIVMAQKLLDKAIAEHYPFNIGSTALKIKAGDRFGARIVWNDTPILSRPTRITAELVGLHWMKL